MGMTDSCPVQLSFRDDTAWLTLDGPRCNAIGRDMVAALGEAVETVRRRSARALVITSANASGFCQGDDLVEAHDRFATRDSRAHRVLRAVGLQHAPIQKMTDTLAVAAFLTRVNRALTRLERLPCPSIAVVHGVCFGGGWELAAACDLVVAERGARFGLPEVRLATLPAFGAVPRLERDLGPALLRDLLLTGRTLSARRLHDLGCVHQHVPKGRGEEVAAALAERFCSLDAATLAHTKAFVKPTPRARLAEERARVLWLTRRTPFREALASFALGGRRPHSYV